MNKVPYIGITDFTTAAQAAIMRALLDDEGCRHQLHVGVMMSYKTLHGLETKWADIFPPKESLQDIFVEREGVLNVLHYADYDNLSRIDDWIEALEWAGPAIDAIQFDMPWPNEEALATFRQYLVHRQRPVQFIIQVSERSMKEAGRQDVTTTRLQGYRDQDCMDYVLFDMSGGKGVPMDSDTLLSYMCLTMFGIPDANIAVAGGLGPTTMYLAEPIVQEFARESIPISFDAQSKLRGSGSALDPVDWGFAAEYLRQAAMLLRRYKIAS